MPESHNLSATLYLSDDRQTLRCVGDWTVTEIPALESQVSTFMAQITTKITVDVSRIATVDTAGILFLQNFIDQLQLLKKTVSLTGISAHFQDLLNLVAKDHAELSHFELPQRKSVGFLYLLGQWASLKWQGAIQLLGFVGELFVRLFYVIRQWRYRHWPLAFQVVNDAGCKGLPIVALLTFLVGIVLTYQIAIQLNAYNINVVIVDVTGMVILREFGPLITAIIASGRTSTAFTAEIGTMKVNEELDALQTMGISPLERLVMPKLLGVLIALPLLTVWADVFGLLGSMLMSKYQMDVSYHLYFDRFQQVIPVQHFIVGLVKAPVFALIITIVGCFQGFSAERTADSVGQKTMQSAVQSIFLVIIADALFSILFSWQGI